MKKTGFTLIALALAFTTACGSDRPSQDEVSKSLTSKSSVMPTAMPKKQADCVAKVLVKSELSDKTLKALVAKDEKYKGTKKDQKVLTGLGTKITKDCLGQ
ncbi:MAG: hypothetical protein M3Q98_03450 [Actinomycetota bacterium]|nr:hypothetical protein [Actinomycetota bacterium]